MSTNVVFVGLRNPVSLCLVESSTVKQLKERVSPGQVSYTKMHTWLVQLLPHHLVC